MRSGSPGMATFPRVLPLSRQILPQPLALAQVTLPGLTAPGEWKSPRVRPPWRHARNQPEGVASRLALCFRHLSLAIWSQSPSHAPRASSRTSPSPKPYSLLGTHSACTAAPQHLQRDSSTCGPPTCPGACQNADFQVLLGTYTITISQGVALGSVS